jgi:hypothetical protein
LRLVSISYRFHVPCHGRGRGFEPRRPRHTFPKIYEKYGPKVTPKSGNHRLLSPSFCNRLPDRYQAGVFELWIPLGSRDPGVSGHGLSTRGQGPDSVPVLGRPSHHVSLRSRSGELRLRCPAVRCPVPAASYGTIPPAFRILDIKINLGRLTSS